MAAYTTALSAITFNGTTFEAVGSMSISSGRAPVEITQVGSRNAHFLPGVLTSAIALDIYYNTTDHSVFTVALMGVTPYAFTFTSTTGDTVTGTAYVTGADIVASMGDIVRGSISLQVTGQITWASTAASLGGNEP